MRLEGTSSDLLSKVVNYFLTTYANHAVAAVRLATLATGFVGAKFGAQLNCLVCGLWLFCSVGECKGVTFQAK